MADRLHLSTRHRRVLEKLLREHLPGVEVWAYDSRVNGRSHEGGDLDLVLRAPGLKEIPPERLADFEEALRESNIPFLIEAHDWARLPERFHREIMRKYVILLEPAQYTIGELHRVSLEDLTDLTLSGVDKKSKENESPVRLCNYMDVYSNNFIHSCLDFMTATATEREINNCALSAGDVVITKDSEKYDDIGVPAFVKESVPDLICGYHLAILRPRPQRIDGKYLFYGLCSDEAKRQFHAYANGVTRFGLRKADIGLVELPVPPLPEQRAIAHVLGTLDDKIELNRRMNETLEAMAQALFKSWFVDFDPVRAKIAGHSTGLPKHVDDLFPEGLVDSEIGEIPRGWKIAPLPELMNINPSRSLKKGEVAPYLGMVNMPTKGHIPERIITRPFGSGTRFTNGDTLVARITPCLENGKTAYVDFLLGEEIGWGSTEYIVIRPKGPLPNEFAYCLARSARFREFAIKNMTGTSGRQRLPVSALHQFPQVAPPKRVAEEFGKLIQPLMAKASTAKHESHFLAELRETLLPKLISGELQVSASNILGVPA